MTLPNFALMSATTPAAAGGPVFTDDWTGSNNAAWSASKWTGYQESNAVCSYTIQSNQGELFAGGANYANNIIFANETIPDDSDVTVKLTASAVAEMYAAVFLRVQNIATYADAYVVEVSVNGNTVRLLRRASSVSTNLQTVTSAGVNNTTQRWLRIQAIGSAIKVRWWNVGDSEPGTWQIEQTNTTFTSGDFGLSMYNGNSTTARASRWDDLTIEAA